MSDIKLTSIQAKINTELKKIAKSIEDSNRDAERRSNAPTQAKSSPYFPDREYSNSLAVQGSPEESKWKEVKTYEQQRPGWERGASETANQETVIIMNTKKLNII